MRKVRGLAGLAGLKPAPTAETTVAVSFAHAADVTSTA